MSVVAKRTIIFVLVVVLATAAAACTTAAQSQRSTVPSAPFGKAAVFVSLDTTRVKAGTAIRGVATVDNRTNSVISLPGDGCGDMPLSVGLANRKISYQPVSATSLCLRALALPVGISHYPITVSTTYQGCSSPPTPNTPVCSMVGGQPEIPPLPAGTYHTTMLLPEPFTVGNTVKVVLTH